MRAGRRVGAAEPVRRHGTYSRDGFDTRANVCFRPKADASPLITGSLSERLEPLPNLVQCSPLLVRFHNEGSFDPCTIGMILDHSLTASGTVTPMGDERT